jgi:predicted dehydrogenase
MKKVAVVGLGKMGLLHYSLLNILPDVKLVALCEKSPLIRRFFKKIFKDISIVADVKELSGLGLDAIYVTTPMYAHFSIIKTIYADRIARHIFVEKPLTSSYAESEELCSLAINQGINMVGYNRRFVITFKKAKEIVDEGTLGELVSFEAYAYSGDFIGVKVGSKTLPPGGVLRDLECHAIDLALWFFGGLEVETAKVESTIGHNSKDSVYFKVRTSRGLAGEFKSSWCMERYSLHGVGLVIRGSEGIMRADEDKVDLKLNNGRSFLWHKHDLGDNTSFLLGGADYFREDQAFVKSIKDGCQTEPSFLTALEVDRVIAQVEEKAGTK